MKERSLFNYSNESVFIGIGINKAISFDSIFSWKELDDFIQSNQGKTMFVFLNFQLGNSILELSKTENTMPLLRIYLPESVYTFKNNKLNWIEGVDSVENTNLAFDLVNDTDEKIIQCTFKPQISKSEYIEDVSQLENHIQQGDIYEVNYCQQIESSSLTLTSISPIYKFINKRNPTPFSSMFESEKWMFASFSPELYLEKKGKELISKPIKGTSKRGQNATEDEHFVKQLESSQKERSENIMIVDLVRNDLSRVAEKGSVQVTELCKVYTYPTVHQMISTVKCTLQNRATFSEIIQATFPMGSMTGAPKKAAVEFINSFEKFNRECYSGSFGVIKQNGDFQLNVLIRTLFYLSASKKITCGVGGAITINSDSFSEYEECKTKIEKIINYLGPCLWY